MIARGSAATVATPAALRWPPRGGRGRRALPAILFGLAFSTLVGRATAQGRSAAGPALGRNPPAAAPAADTGLRARFGLAMAIRLMRSDRPDDRLRGVERAASIHTPEALAVLERVSASSGKGGLDPRLPPEGAARTDPRALLAAVGGLAGWREQEPARAALAAILLAPTASFAMRPVIASSDPSATRADARASGPVRATDHDDADPVAEELEGAARVRLARAEAAMAIASSGAVVAFDVLVAAARTGGPGQDAALAALAAHPPESPAPFAGVALTTPAMVALAARLGDLRALDAILGVLVSSDPAVRAAALDGLGLAGDGRAIAPARAALQDHEPRVRIAAAGALVRLGAEDADTAVDALISDDATALDGLILAQHAQGEGITKSAAARALVNADPEIRGAAVAALGRQTSGASVDALRTLWVDPELGGDVAHALALSPSPAALEALEALAPDAVVSGIDAANRTRRLVGRAYFVRRYTRGDRSTRLDGLLSSLARSRDPRDRAVGRAAQVALREQPFEAGLDDPDPRVRRSVAMSVAGLDTPPALAALLARWSGEPDAATRAVFANGLSSGGADGIVSSAQLDTIVRAGAPDAPRAAFTLARRARAMPSEWIDRLLSARDPVVRAHAARGLAESEDPGATARLARAYRWEADADVRRALIEGVARRVGLPGGDERRAALDQAVALDPDAAVRDAAAHALRGTPAVGGAPRRDVAWLRLAGPAGFPPSIRDETALLVSSEGLAIAVAFDDDGYALVPGVPPGPATVRLAPRLPAYSSGAP